MFILFLKMQTLYKNKLYKAFCNIMLLHQIASKQTVDYQEREQPNSANFCLLMVPNAALSSQLPVVVMLGLWEKELLGKAGFWAAAYFFFARVDW